MLYFSSFINDIRDRDYTPKFITCEFFSTRKNLIKWI